MAVVVGVASVAADLASDFDASDCVCVAGLNFRHTFALHLSSHCFLVPILTCFECERDEWIGS
jgi:hypothetical protein